MCTPLFSFFFFFNDTATTEIYTLSLHDALPIYRITDICRAVDDSVGEEIVGSSSVCFIPAGGGFSAQAKRSEEHTSELQSQSNLVCRLLLEKKKETSHTLDSPNETGPKTPGHST